VTEQFNQPMSGNEMPRFSGLATMFRLPTQIGTAGLDVVGCDLVEVSPPCDTTGNTALLAANLVFEMLCSLPDCARR
jgi:guanidinobutyrase